MARILKPLNAPMTDSKKRLIQQQLVLLLHAQKCLSSTNDCVLTHCSLIKEVLLHRDTCTIGRSCQFKYCDSSTRILSHWNNCNCEECTICLPLRSNKTQTTNDMIEEDEKLVIDVCG